jgi:phosphoglucosamine mutase
MVSASHNPWSDNGIKFFAPGGTKLSHEHQRAIESELVALLAAPAPSVAGVSRQRPVLLPDASSAYRGFLVSQVAAGALSGLRVVLDCAHGSAFEVAPAVFDELGADVVVLHAQPTGRNINEGCGSTHPEVLQRTVVEHGAALGLAFDGDADRVLAVDEHGELVDGDQIMVIMALALRERGELPHDRIAVTVMSNLGLRLALREHGIGIVETPVGDRSVVAAMEAEGLALGGEQSGHIVFGARSGTGDGVLTAVLLAERLLTSGRPLSELAAVMTRLPQALVNVRLASELDLERAPEVRVAIDVVEAELGQRGRVLVRPSGTEPVVRVMVEAPTQQQADSAAHRIADALRACTFAADQN